MLLLMGDRWAAGGFTRMEMVLELVMNVLSRRYYAKIPICVNVESHGLGIWMSLHYSVGTVSGAKFNQFNRQEQATVIFVENSTWLTKTCVRPLSQFAWSVAIVKRHCHLCVRHTVCVYLCVFVCVCVCALVSLTSCLLRVCLQSFQGSQGRAYLFNSVWVNSLFLIITNDAPGWLFDCSHFVVTCYKSVLYSCVAALWILIARDCTQRIWFYNISVSSEIRSLGCILTLSVFFTLLFVSWFDSSTFGEKYADRQQWRTMSVFNTSLSE